MQDPNPPPTLPAKPRGESDSEFTLIEVKLWVRKGEFPGLPPRMEFHREEAVGTALLVQYFWQHPSVSFLAESAEGRGKTIDSDFDWQC